jgi:IS30 family transposase
MLARIVATSSCSGHRSRLPDGSGARTRTTRTTTCPTRPSYRTLFIQARGALKKELLGHLRRTRAMRRSCHHTQKTDDHGRIRDKVSISERPATVEDRAVPGHWEGDLLCGSGSCQIATLVERQTRYVMLVKIASKDSETVINALIRHACKLPQELYRSLTWDRGKEMAGHKRFTVATDIKVYFCDPHHPWQRGSNENTNGLLRQYLPKGTDLSVHSQAKFNAVARRLNERPRKPLTAKRKPNDSSKLLHPPVESAPSRGHSNVGFAMRTDSCSARQRLANGQPPVTGALSSGRQYCFHSRLRGSP